MLKADVPAGRISPPGSRSSSEGSSRPAGAGFPGFSAAASSGSAATVTVTGAMRRRTSTMSEKEPRLFMVTCCMSAGAFSSERGRERVPRKGDFLTLKSREEVSLSKSAALSRMTSSSCGTRPEQAGRSREAAAAAARTACARCVIYSSATSTTRLPSKTVTRKGWPTALRSRNTASRAEAKGPL